MARSIFAMCSICLTYHKSYDTNIAEHKRNEAAEVLLTFFREILLISSASPNRSLPFHYSTSQKHAFSSLPNTPNVLSAYEDHSHLYYVRNVIFSIWMAPKTCDSIFL